MLKQMVVENNLAQSLMETNQASFDRVSEEQSAIFGTVSCNVDTDFRPVGATDTIMVSSAYEYNVPRT